MTGVSTVSVGTTVGIIVTASTGYASFVQDYRIYNNGAQTLFVGGTSGVTAAAGYPVPVSTSLQVALGENESLYGIVGTAGTVDVRVLSP